MMRTNTITDELANLGTALRRYAETMFALLMHEFDKRLQTPFKAIAGALEPVLIIVVFGMLVMLENKKAPVGGSPFLFFGTGLFAKYYFLHVSRIKPPKGLFPVQQWMDQILVHIATKTFDYALLGVVMFPLMAAFLDPNALPFTLTPIAEALACIAMLGFFWGILKAILMVELHVPSYIFAGLNLILVWLSGAFFVTDFMPPQARYVLSFNPTMHAVILFRQGFYAGYPSLSLDTTYLWTCSLSALVLGVIVERAFRRHLAK